MKIKYEAVLTFKYHIMKSLEVLRIADTFCGLCDILAES